MNFLIRSANNYLMKMNVVKRFMTICYLRKITKKVETNLGKGLEVENFLLVFFKIANL